MCDETEIDLYFRSLFRVDGKKDNEWYYQEREDKDTEYEV